MQKIIPSLLVLAAFCISAAKAQTSCIGGDILVCHAMFTYDAAGNRTDRYQLCACEAPPSGRTVNPATANGTAANSADDNATQAASTALSIQPNPTSGKVTIVFASALEKGIIIVTDATGKQVATYTVSGSNYEIDMATLPGGLYVFTLQTADRLESRKVVKTE